MSEKKSNVPKLRFPGFTEPWEQRKLGECAIIKGRLGWKSLKQEEYTDNGPSLIAGKHIVDGVIDWENVDHIPSWRYEESPEIMLENGDVIFSKDGSLGNPAVINNLKGRATINSTMMLVRTNNTIDSNFFYQILTSDIFKRLIYLKVSGSSIPHLFQADMTNFTFYVPNIKEQRKISDICCLADTLITLHQRKLEHVKKLKAGLLQKMFPKDGESIPEVRFPGFTDPWKQRKLGCIMSSLQNNTLSRADLSDEQGVAFNVHYGDILVKFGSYLNVKKEKLPMAQDSSILSKYKNSFLKNGDVVFADTAEDESVGKCSEIANISNEIIISGLHTMPYRPQVKFASGYLGYYLNAETFHRQLWPLMQGIKVTSISKSAMNNTLIEYPKDILEQSKIANVFLGIDNLITLHQRKLEHLNDLKKGLLQQMFV